MRKTSEAIRLTQAMAGIPVKNGFNYEFTGILSAIPAEVT